MTKTASERAQEINQDTKLRAEKENCTMYELLVEDSSHWAEEGVQTGEELDQYLAWSEYVDTYKEVFSIKPRWLSRQDHPTEMWKALTQDILSQRDAILAPEEI